MATHKNASSKPHTTTYLYNSTYKDSFEPSYKLHQKILYKTKLSISAQLHICTLHILFYTSIYENISSPDWVNSKIYPIKSYCSFLG